MKIEIGENDENILENPSKMDLEKCKMNLFHLDRLRKGK